MILFLNNVLGFCVFGFANFWQFEAVTKIYIKHTIYVKCQVTNYDVWCNLKDSIRLCKILVFSWLKLGMRVLTQNRGEIRDWKYARKRGRWDAKNKPWDYGIRGGRDYGIEERYWGPSDFTFQKIIDNAIEPRWLNYLSPISVGLAPEVPVLEFLTNSTKFFVTY